MPTVAFSRRSSSPLRVVPSEIDVSVGRKVFAVAVMVLRRER